MEIGIESQGDEWKCICMLIILWCALVWREVAGCDRSAAMFTIYCYVDGVGLTVFSFDLFY